MCCGFPPAVTSRLQWRQHRPIGAWTRISRRLAQHWLLWCLFSWWNWYALVCTRDLFFMSFSLDLVNGFPSYQPWPPPKAGTCGNGCVEARACFVNCVTKGLRSMPVQACVGTLGSRCSCYSHCADEETEARWHWVTCLRWDVWLSASSPWIVSSSPCCVGCTENTPGREFCW